MDANLRSAGLGVAIDGRCGAADRAVARLAGAARLVGAQGGGAGSWIGAGGGDPGLSHAVADGAGFGRLWGLLRPVPDWLDCAGGHFSLQPDGANGSV